MGTIQVFLEADAPRVNCPAHGPTVRQVPWARHGAGHTRSFDQQVAWLATQCSKRAITELMRIAWRTVAAIITRVWADTAAGVDALAGLQRVGVDEISYKRHHKYLTVVVDHDSGRLVWASPGRERATVHAFFDALEASGPGRCAQITHVTADGAEWIADVVSAFPDTVKSEDDIPDELRAQFRYPENLFKVQRELLAKYHVDEPREFFTTNAFWSVPSDPTDDTNPKQPPSYVLVGDQQTAQPSFRLASAMVGFNREFLSAYISAHSDPENYGKITVLQLPTDTLTQGPQQIQNSMISDTRVASERTLLERSNRIHYGNLLTLPIADGGVLYVEPVYTERISTTPNSSTFPQLSRVLVSVREPRAGGGVRVGYAPTVAEALDQLFGPGTGRAATAPGGDAATAPPPESARPAPPQAAPPAAPAGPGDSPATLVELKQALEDLRAALDRLQRAVDAYETAGR